MSDPLPRPILAVWTFLTEGQQLSDILAWVAEALFILAGILTFLNPGLAVAALAAWSLVLFICGAVLGLAALTRRWRIEKTEARVRQSVRELRVEVSELKGALVVAEEALNTSIVEVGRYASNVLKRLSEHDSLTANYRVSLYLFSDEGLRLVARFSRDVTLTSMSSENQAIRIPLSRGLVGRVARTGDRVKTSAGPRASDEDEYRGWQREHGLTYSADAGPTMKSRLYDVIPSFQTVDSHDVAGVVCVESVGGQWKRGYSLGDALANPSSTEAELIREVLSLMASTTRQTVGGEG